MDMQKYKRLQGAFRHKVPKRILMLSAPKRHFLETSDGMPSYTKSGTRRSALRGRLINKDIAWPYLRGGRDEAIRPVEFHLFPPLKRLTALKRMYKNRLTPERLQVIDRLIEASNASIYSKLANCAINLRKTDDKVKDTGMTKSWTSSEWKKHMDYISEIAASKKVFLPPPVQRGKSVPLKALQPRLDIMSMRPDFKCYKKLSDEEWYKDPEKVSPNALKYEITDRTKKLAEPRLNFAEQ